MKRSQGFSLIELIIVIVLMGIVCGIPLQILSQSYKNYYTAKAIIVMANTTNIAVNTIMREIRNAQGLSSIEATTITFINQQGQTVEIYLEGTQLLQSINSGTANVLCNNVSLFNFGYFNSTYTSTTTAGNVTYVTLNISINPNGLLYSLMSGTVIIQGIALNQMGS